MTDDLIRNQAQAVVLDAMDAHDLDLDATMERGTINAAGHMTHGICKCGAMVRNDEEMVTWRAHQSGAVADALRAAGLLASPATPISTRTLTSRFQLALFLEEICQKAIEVAVADAKGRPWIITLDARGDVWATSFNDEGERDSWSISARELKTPVTVLTAGSVQ
jgi:hypothetical protein